MWRGHRLRWRNGGKPVRYLNGAGGIPERWIQPIGRRITTACLDLGELGFYGNQLPATVDELTDRTERLAEQVILRYGLPLSITAGEASTLSEEEAARLYSPGAGGVRDLGQPVYRFGYFEVAIDIVGDPSIRNGVSKTIGLTIRNRYKFMENFGLRWYLPEGWHIQPATEAFVHVPNAGLGRPEATVEFSLVADAVHAPVNRCVVELSVVGRPTVFSVPVVLLNGNAAGWVTDLDDLSGSAPPGAGSRLTRVNVCRPHAPLSAGI